MKCKDCCYQWKDEEDDYPMCHFEERAPGDIPPCEEEDIEMENYSPSNPWDAPGMKVSDFI